MPERKYSVLEIDQMRTAISYSYPSGVAYYAAERARDIEERLRTHMLNGTEPIALSNAVGRAQAAEQKRLFPPQS